MPRTELAFAGESLDALVWRVTGRGSSTVEAVMRANPGLAAGGRALAEGTPVLIPDAALAPAAATLIQLWD